MMHHYAMKRNPQRLEFNDVIDRLIKINERFLEEDAFSLGINTIWIDSYDDIHDILKSIIKESP
jgi:hypothetical protein